MRRSDTRDKQQSNLYNYKWQKARASFLKLNAICVMCEAQKRYTLATVVDHIVPHRGDLAIFWDSNNWQSLCKQHHDSTKQRSEHIQSEIGGDELGNPIDTNSHWYR